MDSDPYWTEHEYAGRTFLVKRDSDPSQWDAWCRDLLAASKTLVELDKSEKPPKPSNKSTKVRRRPKPKDRSHPRTEAPESILCSVCGEPVQRTGKRGRPRLTHVECLENK